MTLNEIIEARRSIRRYKTTPLEPALIEQVLEAGRLAPSAKNEQAWHFTVVTAAGLRAKLREACLGQTMMDDCPAALVVWSENTRVMRCGQPAAPIDCSIALSFMMLKATELGLGTCWLGFFDTEMVKTALGLPAGASVVGITPLGWPNEAPAPHPRKALSEVSDIRED